MTSRWRLFPKYALLIITLVGGILTASGAIGVYFSWRETEAHLVALQVEKAQSAATRIEQYILDIAHQLSWTALPRGGDDAAALDERQIEYLKLLRQVPAITEVGWIDPQGREQLRISRLAMNVVGSGVDFSKDERFRVASGSATYYGPVSFRKGTEPYMTIARPAGGGGVTATEVNLKFVWDVVSRIKVGTAGLAYVIDGTGTLIAHPDISLVLKKSDLSALPQVAALRHPAEDRRSLALDVKGEQVFAAHAPIAALGWTVFVESPRAEALVPLYATLQRTSLILVAALLISIAASFFLARALVRPLRALQEGAARIGAGDLAHQIEVRTGDEIEGLAEQFNSMSAQLRESYAGLERKVEQRTAELTEALEQQIATSDVLQAISSSVSDAAPVFDKILNACERLFGGNQLMVFLVDDDDRLAIGAIRGPDPDRVERARRLFPLPLAGTASEQAIRERRLVTFADVLNDAGVPEGLRRIASQFGETYSVAVAPMLWESRAIGSILVGRPQLKAFDEKEQRLLRTFADQAVIAIQNARLFNETREALQQQTATAEVLRVISGSIADSGPVFEKILESCAHLFSSSQQGILLAGDDGRLHLAAHRGQAREPLEKLFPAPLTPDFAEAMLERRSLHFRDVLGDAGVPRSIRGVAESIGIGTYSQAFAPMVWEGRPLGALYVTRQPPTGFSEKEIGLLRTFAEQAVIAIQNSRLFNETREALEQQTATAEVLQVISSSVADTQPVFDKILDSCERLFAASGLGIYLVDEAGMLHSGGVRAVTAANDGGGARPPSPGIDLLRAAIAEFPRPIAGSASEIAIRTRSIVHFADVLNDAGAPEPLRRVARATTSFSIAFAPMLWEGRGVGAIQVSRQPPAPFNAKELGLLKTFADQAVIAIQNARLFNEIQAKSRELEMANKHKSEFLANMSHELRTPLNAIIGFSEVLSEKMFGDVNEKQLEYLLDIHSSGHHLLSLINDILDLSKIEAGRMELELATTNLPMLLDNCTTLVRERASRQGLVLALEVKDGIGDWVADVRKLKQVVINLLSNAVKFTPAGGRVTLRARRLEHAVEIAVVDTGVGIAADQQALVFEEFRQAGGDYLRKSEGTGLGLSLAKRFVELHGGTMRVESEPGRGSTFAFVLPERVVEAV